MSDTIIRPEGVGQVEDLVAQIRKAPVKILTRLRNALGTRDLEATVELVQVDEQARRVAWAIIGPQQEKAAEPVPPMGTPEATPTRRTGRGAGLKIG